MTTTILIYAPNIQTHPDYITIGGTNYFLQPGQKKTLARYLDPTPSEVAVSAFKATALATMVAEDLERLQTNSNTEARPPTGDDYNELYNWVYGQLEG
jgi:hypothetical protein